jgi:hypothetical protein
MKRLSSAVAVLIVSTAAFIAPAATIVDDSGTARNGKVGHFNSIVAGGGDVAISYYCEEDLSGNPPVAYALRFAWANGTSWQWTTVDELGGGDTSMARGTDGLYQIVYETWSGMGWATGATTNWSVSPIDVPLNFAAANISMVLDHNNYPHVAYMNLANGGDHSLRYTFYDGTQWVPGGANAGIVGLDLWRPTIGFSNTYLRLDAAGTPHVVFSLPTDPVDVYGLIQYATLQGGAGGTWQRESLGVMGQDPSLAIGSDNVPRVAFNGAAGLVYAYKAAGVWQFETVIADQSGSSVSIALSDAGVPVLSFGLGANEDMYLARREAGGWVVTRIDGDGNSGPHEILGRYGTSVDVDESGIAHVSYLAIDIYSTTWRGDLRYVGPGAGPGPCVNILTSPAPNKPCAGGSAVFLVTASSPGALNYQWRRNGAPLTDGITPSGSEISGANTSELTITNVTPVDEGSYDCVVSADCGSAISNAAGLTIALGATVLMSPHSASVCTGAAALFSVSASGDSPSYQWYRDGAVIFDGPTGTGSIVAGAATPSLAISNVGAADNGQYACNVFNDCGGDTSFAATLTVTTCGGCPGDLNDDHSVDLEDLAIMLSHFGESGASPDDGDIDLDSDVDLSDLATLLSKYGSSCP